VTTSPVNATTTSFHNKPLDHALGVARRHEARGELKQAMESLRQAVQSEPTVEESHVALMRLYAATGQRAQALRQYALLQEVLAAELDAEPDESSRQLFAAILASGSTAADEAVKDRDQTSRTHNLPVPLSRFVGREEEVAEFTDLLSGARLLTLTGVGGAGKTRLAVRLGWHLLDSYRDGVWLVRLDSLGDPDLVAGTVARALQVEEPSDGSWSDALIEHLRSRHALLILDNCEHLLAACSRLTMALLQSCAGLQILATSRARLNVPGEMTAVVPPLSVPDTHHSSVEELVGFEAVRLFVERARFRRPSFALTERTGQAVARICREVEGIPLAIELAAGRIGALSVGQIADRLADAPRLLTSGDAANARHQTLRAALDWSYELLDQEERQLFRRLAVFDGGWVLERLETLSEEHDALRVLDLLTRLVDKSLVVVEGAGDEGVRYRLLEPVRQYGCGRLMEAGEAEEMRRRHLELYAALAESAVDELRRPDARRWLDQLEAEHNNIRAALRWLPEQHRLEPGLRIAGSIWRFWFMRGHLSEGRTVLAHLLEMGGGDEAVPAQIRATAFNAAGALAFYQTDTGEAIRNYEASLALKRDVGDEKGSAAVLSNLALVFKDQGQYGRAAGLLEESRALYVKIGDRQGLATALGNLGILAQECGEYERARWFLEDALALARELGGRAGTLPDLNNLGALALEQGEYERARIYLDESLSLARELGVKRSWFVAEANLGHVARRQGRFEEAFGHYREALVLAQEQGEKGAIAMCLEGIAAALLVTGQELAGVTLFSAAATVREQTKTTLTPVDRTQYDAMLLVAETQLGDEYARAWKSGQNLFLDEMVALAHERTKRAPGPCVD